ncbi:F390 synthetase-related protein [Deinococcus hopiensis]|uniref:Putative adenylate-forming enzyme n=1 Tax=Deinococcus hopiensis KR-140 TaxID=695939 RepID=A0A1W1VFC9_9DEIO|nr:F390 synthetase-related protein [Deinococcus hopiensis]SMB92045.1 putative adenylate-forming enzyme [Deinococcus hopiensis KR-140]
MSDNLTVLHHALAEGALMFRDRLALERHQQALGAEQMRWLVGHSPFLAARFGRARLEPHDWPLLPPTGKTEMMRHFDALNTAGLRLGDVLRLARHAEDTRDFQATLPGGLTVGLSSGTSGQQGVFVVSRAERLHWAGVILRHLLPGWPLSLTRRHRVAFLLRADGGLYRSVQGRRLSFTFLDLLRPVDELAAELTRLDPTVLVGPPSVLRAVLAAGARARPERVVSVAEVLEDEDREALDSAFGPVVQVYQATEGLLGLPCPHGHLHLNEAHVHFELEDLGDGYVQPIVTDLRRRVQPIVRHRLDDLLVMADGCSCGLASRRVLRVAGRQDDALRLPDHRGRRVTVWPDFMRSAMNRVPGLQEYRVEQVSGHGLSLWLDPPTPGVQDAARREVRAALGRVGVDLSALQVTTGPLSPPVPGQKRRRVLRTWRTS